MAWVTINERNKVTGFFDFEPVVEEPSKKFEIDEVLKAELFSGWPKKGYDGENVVDLTEVDILTTQHLYDNKFCEINAEYERALSSLFVNVPQSEIQTWTKQEAEAKAWLANNNASTPLIDALVIGREVDKALLVDKIIAKADAYTVSLGLVLGQRQKFEDLLKVAVTSEEIATIEVKYET